MVDSWSHGSHDRKCESAFKYQPAARQDDGGNGHKASVAGMGEFQCDGIKMNKVLHVPDLAENLVSVSQALDQGV